MFDRGYYENIWGTVHRHDYCPDLAKALVTQHGRVRILDIGTGCGHLVRCLRELGAKASGLEISEYAIANSCAAKFVRYGDVQNIPWASDSFDLVFSQGVWEYIAESDVERAWAECKRVGKSQVHNYEAAENLILPEYRCVTVKPRDWWEAKLQ